MTRPVLPRRSLLYCPGANRKALGKARGLGADGIILDLEDAVAPEAKDEARENVRTFLTGDGHSPLAATDPEIIVRVNGLSTPWAKADLAMAQEAGARAILFPKIEDEADIHAATDRLARAGSDAALWAMIETPRAILNLDAIARTARTHGRLVGLVAGTNDLVKELRLGPPPPAPHPRRIGVLGALSFIVMAARAYGLVAIDGVFNDIADEAGLAAECAEGRALGFEGKTLIHPGQIKVANVAFAPDPAALERARAIVAAFGDPANAGKGVLKVDGAMAELLHYHDAQRLLAEARAIAGRQPQND